MPVKVVLDNHIIYGFKSLFNEVFSSYTFNLEMYIEIKNIFKILAYIKYSFSFSNWGIEVKLEIFL